ncbi:hypothetical protein JJE66_34830 [Bradyrhizobium diazoefficiens]|uniref:hypothetical protein n=1 Tax=Bradyrhizobium diazoefficiens TaxID=1355477 RepID=UPI0019092F9D|nr:hypothetical protein [Bradyrhizobium diazoefficiens]MBK3666376.1 hypothetical protein [Bradyrhizobium diazoefficiens]
MNDKTDLENRVVEAIRHYREALAAVEQLEQEDACALQALRNTLLDLGSAMQDEAAPSPKNSLLEIGSAAVSRSDKAWATLSEATARLDAIRLTLAALVQQLGYIPEVEMRAGDPA